MKKIFAGIMLLTFVCVICSGCGDNKSAASSSAAASSAAPSSTLAAPSSSSAAAASSQAASQASSQASSQEANKAGKLEEVSNPIVTAVIEETKDTSKNYIEYEPSNSAEAVVHIIFSAKNTVKNFRIVKLSAKSVADNGDIEFVTEEAFKVDALTPEKAIRAGVDLGETIPLVGYMYTDDSGKDRLFPLGLSGLDGSLLVWEYK